MAYSGGPNDDAPRVLVLVPSYNHGKYLPRRLESIFNQTYKNFHLLIIDDGSTDLTAEVLRGVVDPRATVKIRPRNSGSPFSAWRDAAEFGEYDYVWIAESDDEASVDFLACGIEELAQNPEASFYYTHSWIIDEYNDIIGHTINYLKTQFPDVNWSRSFKKVGDVYNNEIQIYGNAVPNISSMLMRMAPFRLSISNLEQFRLAADWFFVGRLADLGGAIFDHETRSYFRRHKRTARQETPLERMCVEYFRAILHIGRCRGVERGSLEISMRRTASMFLHERGSPFRFFIESIKIGIIPSLDIYGYFVSRALRHPSLIRLGVMRAFNRRIA